MLNELFEGVSQVPGVHPSAGKVKPLTKLKVASVPQVLQSSTVRIPVANERPCFVVLDQDHVQGKKRYRRGVWYFYLKRGRGESEDEIAEFWVCSPLYVEAVTTDAHHGNYGRLLRFVTTNGHTKTWSMPMALLKGDCSDIRGSLLSMGVEITTSHRGAFSAYLQESTPHHRVQCTTQTGWARQDHTAFVLPDTVIGPSSGDIVYQSDTPLEQEYTRGGDLAGWQTGISDPAVGNPMLVISLCAAFSGPLLALCDMESGGIHLIGDSSSGKTTALLAACSVWGGPGFRRSWRATSNGLEGIAALFNDSLLALDEISECEPRAVSEIVYMLGNGRGKQRANKFGSARSIAFWRSSVLSTGERSIATSMEEGGHRIKAGQAVRILDLPIERRHGAWDFLHQHESGQQFSDALKRMSAMHFGHAGRLFLLKLTTSPQAEYRSRLETIKAQLKPRQTNFGGQVERVLSRFALLALAGELATEFGICRWPPGEATKAAKVGFDSWLYMRGQDIANSEDHQVVEAVMSFIERHGDSRFSDLKEELSAQAMPIRDRAGYWSDNNGARTFIFTTSGMREALKGFDFKGAQMALQKAKLIDPPDAQGKHSRLKRINGFQTRVYLIHPARRWENPAF